MTITAPAPSVGATLDAAHAAHRRTARIAGIWFVVTFVSIAALPLYDSILNETDFIVGASGDTSVQLGAVAEILTAIAGIATAVTLFPILRRQSESLARGYVSLLAVVTLRQDLAGGGTDSASLILSGQSLVAVHDATFLLGPAFCAAIGNGLMLGYLMFRSGLVPRRFAQFGMLAGSFALLTAVLVLFGAYEQVSGASALLTLPEAVWELSLGIYLIVRGFRPDARVLADAR
jgi:hypothetical protein